MLARQLVKPQGLVHCWSASEQKHCNVCTAIGVPDREPPEAQPYNKQAPKEMWDLNITQVAVAPEAGVHTMIRAWGQKVPT